MDSKNEQFIICPRCGERVLLWRRSEHKCFKRYLDEIDETLLRRAEEEGVTMTSRKSYLWEG